MRRCRVFRRLLLREFSSAALLPLLLPEVDRRRGQSAGHSLWLGPWLGLVRNWSFWRNRGGLGLTAVWPRKIIGTAGRGSHCLTLRQNFRGNRVALDRIAAGRSKEVVRSLFCPSAYRSSGSPVPSAVARSALIRMVLPRTVRKAEPPARDYLYSGSIPVRHSARA